MREARDDRRSKVAEALLAGEPIGKTMLANGYSESTADQGLRAVPRTALKLLLEKQNPEMLAILEAGCEAVDYKALVLARLTENAIKGRDGGVASAKALGSIRELNMFTPDSQVGVIVVAGPEVHEAGKLVSGDSETEG